MNLPPSDEPFEALLAYIKANRGFDFTGYKRSTLMRRFQRRMQAVGVSTYPDYRHYLEGHADEFVLLFNTFLINVTGFFRDPASWEFLARQIIPRLLAAKDEGEPIRIWSAGCASGEEAYTAAILLAEALGMANFSARVKIYATDVDEEALNTARAAVYQEREVAGVPPAYLEKYFERVDDHYAVRKDLRRAMIFGRHDLMQDAPISRVDLLICRNTLMYFQAPAQARVLARLHFALRDSGFLFLGRAEMLLTHTDLFAPVDLRYRVFTRVRRENRPEHAAVMVQGAAEENSRLLAKQARLRDAAFEVSPSAQIVLDGGRILILANERARALFGLAARDVGTPSQDLEPFQRLPDLRAAIEHVLCDRRPASLREMEWLSGAGDIHSLDVQAIPLLDRGEALVGISVGFQEVSEQKRLQRDLEQARHEIETTSEELQLTNEEMETANEELESTSEELETTNEELQSTNEELATINEELQSANGELEIINEELHRRTAELSEVNGYLGSILSGLRAGVAVLDREQRVRVWNESAEELWGVRRDEAVGQYFMNLKIGLPVEQICRPLRATLSREVSHQDVSLRATNRRGRSIAVRVCCTPLYGPDKEVAGAILLMEDLEAEKIGPKPAAEETSK